MSVHTVHSKRYNEPKDDERPKRQSLRTTNNNEDDASKTNNKELMDVTYVENKERARAQETPNRK